MLMIENLMLSASLAATMTFTFACGGEAQNGPEGQSGSVEVEDREAPTALTPAGRAQAQRALRAYERIRAALAADDGQVADAAREIAAAADAAAADAPAALRPHLSGMAGEARDLAAVSSSDLGALRRQFGELSRTVLALLHEERSLAQGLHAFECGMAEGYGRWVQPSAELSNPYMGTRMPECGTPSDIEPG